MTKEELIYEIQKRTTFTTEVKDLFDLFFLQNVVIPKGENRHPDADVIHKLAEDISLKYEADYFYPSWVEGTYITDKEHRFRIKPQEPVYEWQWYYIENGEGINAGWMTYDEASTKHDDIYNEKDYYVMQETKRVRQ